MVDVLSNYACSIHIKSEELGLIKFDLKSILRKFCIPFKSSSKRKEINPEARGFKSILNKFALACIYLEFDQRTEFWHNADQTHKIQRDEYGQVEVSS